MTTPEHHDEQWENLRPFGYYPDERQEVNGWQGIESAPRDGTPVLLLCRHAGYDDDYVIEGWYESGIFDRCWYEGFSESPLKPAPTHWQPLPLPPSDGGR